MLMITDDEIKASFFPIFKELLRRVARGELLEVICYPDGEYSVQELDSEEGYVVYVPEQFDYFAEQLSVRRGYKGAFEEFWTIEGKSIIEESRVAMS